MKPVFEAALKKVGLVSLGSSTGGIRQVYSKKPLRSIEDFRGIKIRTMEVPTIISTFRALRTNPVPMSVGEVYSALQSGVIDACESSFLTWINSKHFEVAKYGIQLNYMDSGRSYVANQKFMDRLDPKLRNAIEQAMTESIVYCSRI